MPHPTLEETVAFMKKAHEGQVDKTGIPYWKHPYAVAEIVRDVYGGGEAEQHAALLHDVIEDTDYTAQDLLDMGYSPQIVDMVVWVTKMKGLTYQQWMEKLAERGPIGAVKVKLADNQHNTSRPLPPGMEGIKRRYEKARKTLLKRFNQG